MAPNIIKYYFFETLTLMECLKFDSFYDTHFKRVILTQILENYLGTGVGFAEGP